MSRLPPILARDRRNNRLRFIGHAIGLYGSLALLGAVIFGALR